MFLFSEVKKTLLPDGRIFGQKTQEALENVDCRQILITKNGKKRQKIFLQLLRGETIPYTNNCLYFSQD
jgi:hypothetical protein